MSRGHERRGSRRAAAATPNRGKGVKKDVKRLLQIAQAQGCTVQMGARHWKVRCPGGLVTVSASPSSQRAIKAIRSDLRRAGVAMNPGDCCPGRAYAPRGSTYEMVVINPAPPQWPEELTVAQREALSLMLRSAGNIVEEAHEKNWSSSAKARAKKLGDEAVKWGKKVKPFGVVRKRHPKVDVELAIKAFRKSEDFWSLQEGKGAVPAWPAADAHAVRNYETGVQVSDWRGDMGHIVAVQRGQKGKPNRVLVDWDKWGRQTHFPLELEDWRKKRVEKAPRAKAVTRRKETAAPTKPRAMAWHTYRDGVRRSEQLPGIGGGRYEVEKDPPYGGPGIELWILGASGAARYFIATAKTVTAAKQKAKAHYAKASREVNWKVTIPEAGVAARPERAPEKAAAAVSSWKEAARPAAAKKKAPRKKRASEALSAWRKARGK